MNANKCLITCCIWLLVGGGVSTCPSQCYCQEEQLKCIQTNLTNFDLQKLTLPSEITEVYLSNNNIVQISSQILEQFQNVHVLSITYNHIKTIPRNTFQKFKNLRKLILNDNEINNIETDSFQGLETLINLELQRNELIFLPERIFDRLTSIQSIRLQSNEIQSIPNNVFTNLKTLRSLFVTRNKLTKIDNKAFQNLSMNRLGLSFNFIKTIPITAFQNFHISGKILLLANPLDCQCESAMKYAHNMQHLQNAIWAYCATPDNAKDTKIMLAHQDMLCSLCDLKPCLNKGECYGNKTDYTCKCTDQFKGKICEHNICGRHFTIEVGKTTYMERSTIQPSLSRQKIVNRTKYIVVKEKITNKDTENKLMILYAMCSLEFLVIIAFVAYILLKHYRKWRKQTFYEKQKSKEDLISMRQITNAKLVESLYQEKFPFDVHKMMKREAVPV